ncbi:multicopper oxidase family protein [Pseudahrensia aquimaris]|uniref:Multicopper oxidase family protein n=1 Tax=Pseudahrensia aquimaris TaxID=744461 RepID=A0ABW3FGE2_9HYPH
MDNRSHFNRRDFIKFVGLGVGALAVPTLVVAEADDGFIDLRATKTAKKLAGSQSAQSDLWLYNGTSPGPEIRVKQGQTVRVRFTNELDEPTSVHWHGIRIVNAMDGVPGLTQDAVGPGETFEYIFDVPDAGTFWYHAHNRSWEQVALGLYGPLIVEEADPVFDRSHDLILMIDDWRLDENGVFDFASLGFMGDWSHAGRLGGWLTVNGQSQPTIKLALGESYRLRLINAANARIMFIDPSVISAEVIAYDGFPFAEPRAPQTPYEALLPAQRMDLLVTPTEKAVARLNDLSDFALTAFAGRESLSIAVFDVVESSGTQKAAASTTLPMNPIAQPDLENAMSVSLNMEGGAMGRMGRMMHNGMMMGPREMRRTGQFWSFNGVANFGDKPLFEAKKGQTIVLTTDNQTGWPHGIHLHGHHFQIIEHNGKTPKHFDWRDTFTIERDEQVKIAFVADNPGNWLLHCHMLEHSAAGMKTWFKVI